MRKKQYLIFRKPKAPTFGLMFSTPQNSVRIQQLCIHFDGNPPFEAVQDVAFEIEAGKTLALVGQSGSGKSLTSLALMGLLPPNATVTGAVTLPGSSQNLLGLDDRGWQAIRGKAVGMIFQEPMSALNPVKTCGAQLVESIQAHNRISAKEARGIALEWFKRVKLPRPEELLKRYPHQLSGGQKQRVMIAMAMCHHPALLIADEPTTALDVTVQQEIIALMQELQEEYGTAILFITHDLALARSITNDFLVLEKGKVISGSMGYPHFPQAAPVLVQEQEQPILKVEAVKIYYPEAVNWLGKTIREFKAVDNVSFELFRGETLGLVGESGCGKSTLSKSILGLQQVTEGSIYFEGHNITTYNREQWRVLRRDIQIIFQDPYASLNPRIKAGDALAEPLKVHGLVSGKDVDKAVENLLEMVQLPAASKNKYPHEFSGGQRQRICIARALAVRPKLIICDESVSALDIKIQAQILELLTSLQKQQQLTYLFITHDLNVVKSISNRIMVMEKGKIVEEGFTDAVMKNPQEAYTQRLLAAVPH